MSVDPLLLGRVRARLVGEGSVPDPDQVTLAVRAEGRVLGDVEQAEMVAALQRELLGAGPLEPLLRLPGVTDVLVNGAHGTWVDTGDGLRAVDVPLSGEAQVRALAVRLAALAGRRLDDAAPWVDARLPDGSRLHAVLPPLVEGGTHISLRVPARRTLELAALVAAGTVPVTWAPLVEEVVRRRVAFLVSGGTGAGKTTLLAALLGRVPPTERLVVVEDSAELRLGHPHTVRLQARPPNVEGRGGVDLADLVRQALRMRPDRLVVGEVRGAEVRELLTALNTGHEGGCGTVHANSPADVPARLEALGALAGMSREAVHAQAASAVRLVLHMARAGSRRRLVEVGVLTRHGPEVVVATAIAPDGATGPGWPALRDLVGTATADAAAGGGLP